MYYSFLSSLIVYLFKILFRLTVYSYIFYGFYTVNSFITLKCGRWWTSGEPRFEYCSFGPSIRSSVTGASYAVVVVPLLNVLFIYFSVATRRQHSDNRLVLTDNINLSYLLFCFRGRNPGMRFLYLQRDVVERERPAFLQRGAVGAPILHTVRRTAVHVHQHRSGRVGQEDSGRGAKLQRRPDGQIEEKSNYNNDFVRTYVFDRKKKIW